jgi:HK97 family phage prohead protease
VTKKKQFDGLLSRTVDFILMSDEERAGGEEGSTGRKLSGYAAVFNEDTPIRSWEGTFNERIAPGAFKKTLAERKPVMQFDHGRDTRFGSLPIGNFTTLREDSKGLYVEGDLFDHAEPIRQAIESGAVNGMSFKFGVTREAWHDAKGKEITSKRELQDLLYGDGKDINGEQRGPIQRTIKEVRLMEAGPVVFPAYPQTSVGVRSAAEQLEDAGLTAEDVMQYVGRSLADDETSAPDGERTSEDSTSEQPDGVTDAAESREEAPDDAAQAGTSTGMSQNARERWMALNGI